MPRVLICVPHYYRHEPDAVVPNGSAIDGPDARASTVRYCLRQMAAQLADTAFVLGTEHRIANDLVEVVRPPITGDIVLCTTENNHLWDKVSTGAFIKRRISTGDPRLLAYECRRVFAENIGKYDFYMYIEDDMAIHDTSFFDKIAVLYQNFGDDVLFLPNRYEIFGEMDGAWKAYIDLPLPAHFRIAPNTTGAARLSLEGYAGPIHLDRTLDQMAGCYTVSNAQLAAWVKQDDFNAPPQSLLDRGMDPIEISTIPMMGAHPVYRAARENMSFLEVHHVATRATRMSTPRRKIVEALRPEIARRTPVMF